MRARTTLTLAVISILAISLGAGVTAAGGDEQWRKALQVRSEALNEKHGLGDSTRQTATRQPAWLTALMIRSDALNRRYGLGQYARKPAAANQPAWLEALMIRSDALNRQYKLGRYAPRS